MQLHAARDTDTDPNAVGPILKAVSCLWDRLPSEIRYATRVQAHAFATATAHATAAATASQPPSATL